MSWSNHMRSIVLTSLLLVSGCLLGACSFQPVYSGALASNPTFDLAYAKPNSRLEQIIYQELALRLGSSAAPSASLASVAVSTGSGGIAAMTSNPGVTTPVRVSVTATLTITPPVGVTGASPVSITRTAVAQYTTTGQVLADTTAATEAGERAARAAAESLRLGVLATLSR